MSFEDLYINPYERINLNTFNEKMTLLVDLLLEENVYLTTFGYSLKLTDFTKVHIYKVKGTMVGYKLYSPITKKHSQYMLLNGKIEQAQWKNKFVRCDEFLKFSVS